MLTLARDAGHSFELAQDVPTPEAVLSGLQKMEAIGRLAGGVAHDFNNLLTVINGCAELLLEDLPAGDPRRELVQDIQTAGDRAAALTRQILTFSRKQVLVPVVLNLNAQLEQMRGLLLRLLGAGIEIRIQPGADLWNVECDPGQAQQIIMNLAINARDAMPRGGRLTILTGNVVLDRQFCEQHPEVQPGEYVLLAISDTGHGMDEATRSRIFEPFFTTKENGKGGGLGLAIVYGVVQQWGGAVEVTSEVRKGATFGIYLPRCPRPLPSASASEPATSRGGSETILLAEDEAAVRSLARTILEEQGYTVLTASDGAEALSLSARHPEPIHALVSDVIMPGIQGPELARSLSQFRPGLRVLLMSGYTGDTLTQYELDDQHVPFLPKPFTAAALTRRLREVLDGPRFGEL